MIENRQFRERGLLHITDKAHTFFLSLEQRRVEKIKERRLDRLKDNVVQVSINEVCEDEKLLNEFCNCFELMLYENQVSCLRTLSAMQWLI